MYATPIDKSQILICNQPFGYHIHAPSIHSTVKSMQELLAIIVIADSCEACVAALLIMSACEDEGHRLWVDVAKHAQRTQRRTNTRTDKWRNPHLYKN